MALDKTNAVSLAWHALFIAAIIFVGILLGEILGGLIGAVPVVGELGGIVAETLQWTGIVTAILYAFQAS